MKRQTIGFVAIILWSGSGVAGVDVENGRSAQSGLTYAELSRINSETKIVEAKVRLGDAQRRLKSVSETPNLPSTDTNPSINSAANLVSVVAVTGTSHKSRGLIRLATGSLTTVEVGSQVPGLGVVTSVSYEDGIRVNGQALPFEPEVPSKRANALSDKGVTASGIGNLGSNLNGNAATPPRVP